MFLLHTAEWLAICDSSIRRILHIITYKNAKPHNIHDLWSQSIFDTRCGFYKLNYRSLKHARRSATQEDYDKDSGVVRIIQSLGILHCVCVCICLCVQNPRLNWGYMMRVNAASCRKYLRRVKVFTISWKFMYFMLLWLICVCQNCITHRKIT